LILTCWDIQVATTGIVATKSPRGFWTCVPPCDESKNVGPLHPAIADVGTLAVCLPKEPFKRGYTQSIPTIQGVYGVDY